MLSLDGRVILISGSGPGLGARTAETLLKLGAAVVLADLHGEIANRTSNELGHYAPKCLPLACDIRSDRDCQFAVDSTLQRFGHLDGIVNVAAMDTDVGGVLSGAVDDWPNIAAVNVEGTLRIIKYAAPSLEESGRGAVVIIGSTGAVRPRRSTLRLAYGASKGALSSATRYLAQELGPRGVTVNNIAPGFKDGPKLQEYFEQLAESQGISKEAAMAPLLDELALGRFASDDDVAAAVSFFLSGNARNITGQTLYVDGGHVME